MEPRVLVVLDTAAAWSRGILKGFFKVAHEQGWTVLHYHPGTDPEWLVRELAPTVAVVGPTRSRQLPEALRSLILVSVNADRSADGVSSVSVDEARVAELALQHFVSRGLKDVTTFRFDDSPFAVARDRGFIRVCETAGIRITPGWWRDDATPPRSVEDPPAIEAWLRGLPRPCGVFTCCDAWGRVVARYARSAQLRVPEDLALLGVDNDTMECELIAPPLSSVAVPWRRIGEEAALLVRAALAGQVIVGRSVAIDPVDVVARRSSDAFAIDDALVRQAVDWIQYHADRRVTVSMVAEAVQATRQRLERRFRAHLGRTVMQEVRRTHVEAAKQLLATSRMTLPDVASRSGFTTAALLNEAFRRETGLTPGEYRRRVRGMALDN